MAVQRKLNPGDPGTKKYLDKYGDRLVSIRYRLEKNERITTVELIENRKTVVSKTEYPHNKKVFLKIKYDEYEMREKVKKYGGIWDLEKKLWKTDYKTAKELKMTDRIVEKERIVCRKD